MKAAHDLGLLRISAEPPSVFITGTWQGGFLSARFIDRSGKGIRTPAERRHNRGFYRKGRPRQGLRIPSGDGYRGRHDMSVACCGAVGQHKTRLPHLYDSGDGEEGMKNRYLVKATAQSIPAVLLDSTSSPHTSPKNIMSFATAHTGIREASKSISILPDFESNSFPGIFTSAR